ncbi:hypothetical protein [Massilia sp. Se16.2.3]|uniref:hypothetical protein n=1 Tax=Massilia sp. Se16.2.3 TaxID=2709303 RepID=UPI00160485FA|nr:hypothetical protein [Massilia sp. Se16.2.3]QNA99038.1 hypothetical protein G4G31_09560 [Massilia sp. Se16.2.3]
MLAMAAGIAAAAMAPFAAGKAGRALDAAGIGPAPAGCRRCSPPPGDWNGALFEQARAWIAQQRRAGDTTVLYPISRLQRTLRTGYRATCNVTEMLVQQGEWTIGFMDDGTRYARIADKRRA